MGATDSTPVAGFSRAWPAPTVKLIGLGKPETPAARFGRHVRDGFCKPVACVLCEPAKSAKPQNVTDGIANPVRQ